MAHNDINALIIEDSEARRNTSLRWLSGHNGDALLFLLADKRSVLVPWDFPLAQANAHADHILPYNEFGRDPIIASKAILDYISLPKDSRVEISGKTPYPTFLLYVEILKDWHIICQFDGVDNVLEKFRSVKDEHEIAIYRKASAITNEVIDLVTAKFESGKALSELDIALFIDAEGRKRGCEGTSFETLAAGKDRSFAIHAFPSFTNAPIGDEGLSILDFGLRYKGYSTDVTMTIARGNLSPAQNRMLNLVQKAYDKSISSIRPGMKASELSKVATSFFAKSKKTMPHSLGHGIGLDAHEQPFLRERAENYWTLKPGMIFTIEPGLYDPRHGGCRLENDVLLTDSGIEILTNSRILRL